MTFEEDFPSFTKSEIDEFYTKRQYDLIENHCLDKSKVREAIIKKGNKLAYDRANHIQSADQEKLIIVQLSILEDLLKELGLTSEDKE